MTTPFWADDSLEARAWDFCWIGGDLLPGVVVDFKCPNRRRLDQQPTPGKDGVTLKDTGYELTPAWPAPMPNHARFREVGSSK